VLVGSSEFRRSDPAFTRSGEAVPSDGVGSDIMGPPVPNLDSRISSLFLILKKLQLAELIFLI
jgi:hypothetical protein